MSRPTNRLAVMLMMMMMMVVKMMGLLRVMKVVERTVSAQVQSVNGRSGRENFHLIGSYED